MLGCTLPHVKPLREAQRRIGGGECEVVIGGPSPSAVLVDQVKSLDWRRRRAKRKGALSAGELAEVRAKLRALIG